MAWEKEKHVTKAVVEITINPTASIMVERFSYDGAPDKIKLGKVFTKSNGVVTHAPISGIDMELVSKVAQAMIQLSEA